MNALKTPAAVTYREALQQLRAAEEAIDQAHAMLRDLNLHDWIETGRGPYRQTLNSAYGIVHGLCEDLQNVLCPECGQPMAERTDCLEQRCKGEGNA
jgi:hypothetical protein